MRPQVRHYWFSCQEGAAPPKEITQSPGQGRTHRAEPRGWRGRASQLGSPNQVLVQDERGLELPASQVHLQTLETGQVSTSCPQEGP